MLPQKCKIFSCTLPKIMISYIIWNMLISNYELWLALYKYTKHLKYIRSYKETTNINKKNKLFHYRILQCQVELTELHKVFPGWCSVCILKGICGGENQAHSLNYYWVGLTGSCQYPLCRPRVEKTLDPVWWQQSVSGQQKILWT